MIRVQTLVFPFTSAIPAGSGDDQYAGMPGAVIGDVVVATNASGGPNALVVGRVFVNAPNIIGIVMYNGSAGPITPGNMTFHVALIRL